jgi:signal transduction histidine kinase/CheY-like chemotaxis protein/HPt (histidine-containing phosphotransfer) domain-containing protein
MGKIGIRYLVFWLFLLGIIVIVFLQVVSGNNINRLIEGNRRLLNEMRLQNNIRELQADVLTLESDIRGAVITRNPQHLLNVESKIADIEQEVRQIQKEIGASASGSLRTLEVLVSEKIRFSRQLLAAFSNDTEEAHQLINTNKGKNIRDSIMLVATRIDSIRQSELTNIFGSIERSGKRAQFWGFVFSVVALLALIGAFLYIINKGRQQTRMIESLNKSEKRNKEAGLMKEQFMANMSHEIRTPMNSILGFTSLLRRTQLSQEQQEYVQNIHSAGENLLALVNDILDLSKIEAGMMQLEETRFSLRSLMSSVGAMFNEKLREKQLVFELIVDRDIPDILSGDAVRLTQILVNLLSNAVKFTEKGQVLMRAELLDQQDSEVRIRVLVADTGIGIAPDKQRKIFDRFQQAEAETTRRFGGTGLGLAIVKQLVELQRGQISLKSEPGQGSEFTVELPFRLPDLEQLYSSALASQEELVPIKSIRVLIAEDHPMNQQLIGRLMESWGIDYQLVGTGEEAVAALRRQEFSLVLMDIQMPEMDGYTATSIIRKEMKEDIPVIAMTAHAMAGEKEKCLQLGMNDYISKPIKETILYNMIASHARSISGDKDREQTALISLDYLHQLSGNDAEFEREILRQFLVQLPEELTQLEEAIRTNNFTQSKRVAHSLKSTVGYVGLAEDLHPYLDRIEKEAVAQHSDDLMKVYAHVRQQCELALEEVKRIVA